MERKKFKTSNKSSYDFEVYVKLFPNFLNISLTPIFQKNKKQKPFRNVFLVSP